MDWKNVQDDAKIQLVHSSKNAGYPMAVLAGALNVTLEKPIRI